MSTPAARFATMVPPAAAGSIARAVLGRLSARHAAWALGLVLAAQVFGPNGVGEFGLEALAPEELVPRFVRDVLGVSWLMLAILFADEAVARGRSRLPTYALAIVAGSAVAAALQPALLKLLGVDPPDLAALSALERTDLVLHLFSGDVLYGTLGCLVYIHRRTARLALERTHAAELAREQTKRRTLESQLQAMQARVEPQFLFNTLAQVRELYDRDPASGGRMLDDLIAYLRAALPHLRESSSTLGQEVALARAYLDIMRVRLGGRLAFVIDVPEAAREARLPPMMLLPLVDHALVYGLQTAEAGGTMRIEAHAAAGRLKLSITDSGAGFVPRQGDDELAGIGERLHALYGDLARFELERLRERAGTRATLEIPYEEPERGHR